MGWFRHNMNICAFLQSVPASHKIRICGEDLLANPDSELRRIVCWLDLENNDAIITAIKHPENSPYAFIDPARAPMHTSARSTGCCDGSTVAISIRASKFPLSRGSLC